MKEIATKLDGSGQGVTLRIMPRTEFAGLGFQTGVGLVTTKDGESVYEQAIGLSDDEVEALIAALREEKPF